MVVDLCFTLQLLRRNSSVTLGDVYSALRPAALMTAGMCAAVLATRFLLLEVDARPWVRLVMMAAAGGVSYAAALLWTPFTSVAVIVRESVDDLVPWVRRLGVGILRENKPSLQE